MRQTSFILIGILGAAMHVAPAGTPDKSPKEAVITPAEAWGYPLLGGGVKTSDVYVEGSFFLTLPLYSSIGLDGTLGGDYIFVEPYTSWGEQGEVASSLGFGWRHLFNVQPVSKLNEQTPAGLMDEGWYLGANLFVDRLDTQFDNVFWQMGIGAEIGSRYLEVRGNYYIPFNGDKKLAFKDVQKQTVTSTTTSKQLVQEGTTAGAPFAAGNAVFQDTGGNVTEVTTTRTTTTTFTRTTSIFEEGMEGWDAEMALLVPWVDQWCDVKLIGGYFAFDNQPFGPQTGSTGNVEGWKAGLEVRPVPAVVLNAMWYDDERFTGSDWTLGVRFEIPLGKEWKDAFRPRRRHLVERMAEPVHRQNAAVKIGNSKEEEEESQSTTTTAVVRRVVSQGQGTITIAEDVIFVNNGPAPGNGIQEAGPVEDGTAEKPFNTLQEGATTAGDNSNTTGRVWTAYVQGGGGNYEEDIDLKGRSVNFVASGPRGGFAAQGGYVFGNGGVSPVIDGGIQVEETDVIGVRGFIVQRGHDGSGDLLRMENIGRLTITNNELRNASDDAILFGAADFISTAVISNNLVTTVADDFIDVQISGNSDVDLTVQANTVSDISFQAIEFDSSNASQVTFNFLNNDVRDVDGPVLDFIVVDSSVVDLTARGNIFRDIGELGLILDAANSSDVSIDFQNNELTNLGNDGMHLDVSDSAVVDAIVSGNQFTNILGPAPTSGVVFHAFGPTSSLDVILNGNTFTNLSTHGIALDPDNDNTLTLNGTINNIVTGAGGNKLDSTGTGTPTGTIILNGVAVPVNTTVP